jgi:hypothetical protein
VPFQKMKYEQPRWSYESGSQSYHEYLFPVYY